LGAARLIRVLIADANMLFRTGIRTIVGQYLGQCRTPCEIEEAASGAEALQSMRAQRWNLCLMDISLPQRGGLEILRYVRKAGRQTKVLFLGSYTDRQYAPVALRLGANGFLLKDCTREELVAAFRTVSDGSCYVSPQLSEQLIAATCESGPSYAKLSQREFQIFQKLARGTAITVISQELSISPKSVSTYRSRILEKMRCRNNAEITQYAMREGLI
jgi:two-component system, NarL family, invasion response regulator UvrY